MFQLYRRLDILVGLLRILFLYIKEFELIVEEQNLAMFERKIQDSPFLYFSYMPMYITEALYQISMDREGTARCIQVLQIVQ